MWPWLGYANAAKQPLLQQLSSPWQLFDLEKASDFEIISKDPDLFLRLHSNQVAIDEAQLLPELFASLRVAIDADRGQPGRFIITGSSSPELISSISESLARRVAILELSPFTFAETQRSLTPGISLLISNQAPIQDFQALKVPKNIIQAQHDYWFRGGYPEPWLQNNPRFTKLWMQNYVQTYLNRDIQQLFPGLNRQKFKFFLQMLSNLSGTIINYSNVARTLGVSQPTAREYFHIANGTFI